MRRSRATFVLAVFLLGTIASADAFARGGGGRGGHGGRGGQHASGSMHAFRAVPRSTVVVTAPLFFGGYRAPYYAPFYGYSAAPFYGYSAAPYYSGAPYYPAAPYYRSTPYYPSPYYSTPYYPPEYIEQSPDQPAPQPGPEQQPGADPQPAPQQQSAPVYWFCPSANNYFPYVRTCTSGWQQVSP
jgi:hypothetical protein